MRAGSVRAISTRNNFLYPQQKIITKCTAVEPCSSSSSSNSNSETAPVTKQGNIQQKTILQSDIRDRVYRISVRQLVCLKSLPEYWKCLEFKSNYNNNNNDFADQNSSDKVCECVCVCVCARECE